MTFHLIISFCKIQLVVARRMMVLAVISHSHWACVSCLHPLVSSKARRADDSKFLPADSSPGMEAKENRTSRPRALRAGTDPGQEQPPAHHLWGPPHPWALGTPHHPALGAISLWTCLLAGGELGLSRLAVTCPRGYNTPKGLPLQFSRIMFTGHASHSL